MTYSTEELINLSIILPITQAIKERAEQFAAQYPEHLREQARLNTLAVLVTNNYLYMQGYETNLSAPKRWNAVFRFWEDAADLEITGLGCLECRPIRVNESSCRLPPEVWSNRIGYLLVQIDEENKEAKLLGFVPPFHPDNPLEELSVANLQSMDDFIDYLFNKLEQILEQIKKTLEEIFGKDWKAPELVQASSRLELRGNFRSVESSISETTVRKAKRIELPGWELKLLVEVKPESNDRLSLCLRIYPLGRTSLPPSLELALLDKSGELLKKTNPEEGENEIDLEHSIQIGEDFSIRVTLENSSITENFNFPS